MNNRKRIFKAPVDPIGKFVGGAMGLIFAGIGVTVLIFLWGMPFGEFGSPPIFFRIFGSFIALAFVVIGGSSAMAVVFVTDKTNQFVDNALEQSDSLTDCIPQNTQTSYSCPKCGAPLGTDADVSPHGDAKCAYCSAWFNIHSQ
jgi:hypothetical protein